MGVDLILPRRSPGSGPPHPPPSTCNRGAPPARCVDCCALLDPASRQVNLIVGLAPALARARTRKPRQLAASSGGQWEPMEPRTFPASAETAMLRTASFAIALLLLPATGATADVSSCAQGSELAAARQRWVAARQARADPGDAGKSCRAYGNHFYEAVQARYAASLCEDSINRQRSLNMLDAEIDAFNNL